MSGEYQLSQRLRIGAVFGVDKIDHKGTDLRDGPNYSALVQGVYGIDEVSLARLFAGFSREVVTSKSLRNWRFRLGGSYCRELPFGLTGELTVESGFGPFDAALVALGNRRKDVSVSAGQRFTTRDWDLWGFAPVVGYLFVRNFSNIDFSSYARHRGNFEFTRAF